MEGGQWTDICRLFGLDIVVVRLPSGAYCTVNPSSNLYMSTHPYARSIPLEVGVVP